MNVSVVIITKNEAENIAACIQAAFLVSDDIIVMDSGSKDETVALAKQHGAHTLIIAWKGYGDARNQGAAMAKNEWVLSIDADERMTPKLADSIKAANENDPAVIYGFKRQNYFLGKKIRFGEWGKDKVYRLYHRAHVSWDLSPVHEHLTGTNTQTKILSGALDHYPVTKPEQNEDKTLRYAKLNAQKLFAQGKRAGFVKRYLSPAFNFIRHYFLLLGFLDGAAGFAIARVTSKYVWLKYQYLHQLDRQND